MASTPHDKKSMEVDFRMTIERLPHKYPIGSTVWTDKGYGTILFHIGKYHLVWLQRLGLA